ncbi:DUF397 domain-containing protein [Streptomyces sp. NBC_00487]|uniref:DUF397 domain-containing protein n=1 Tax=unclassified Streptomyces TaxID=2593676 RepID=UPI002DD9FC42|nr:MULTISPECIES: DUF397 domain-containing protein [unclassified Streptomyces]WRY97913.1 DUF397 domain-containing protein [Streptomyces sp. NBC_00481]
MNHALRWQRSTFSGGGEGNTCVELAAISPHLLGLRESDVPGAVLTTTPAPVTELLRAITSGRFTPRRP